MYGLLALGLMIGLDNFRAGIGIGTLGLEPRRRWQLALSFGFFEAMMPLLGVVFGRSIALDAVAYGEWMGSVLLAACGICVLLGSLCRIDARSFVSKSPMLLLIPLALSIDNLLAGAAIVALDVPLIVGLGVVGLVSVSLSCFGLYLGAGVLRCLPKRCDVLAGCALIALSVVTLVT